MQVSNGNLLPSTAQVLKRHAEQAKFQDKDLVYDVYLVLEALGKPTFQTDAALMGELERGDPEYHFTVSRIANRKEYLEKLANTQYMKQLVLLKDPMKAVLLFIDHMNKAEAAAIAARQNGKTKRASMGVRGTPSNGEAMDEVMLDQIAQEREQFAGDLDSHFDNLTSFADVTANDAVSAFINGATGTPEPSAGDPQGGQSDEDYYLGAGVGTGRYDATTTPGEKLARAIIEHGHKLPAMFPAIFDQFTKISAKLGLNKVVDTIADHVTDRTKRDDLDEVDKISSADPADLASPTFAKQVADRSLQVNHNQAQVNEMSNIFVLLDVSSSMQQPALGNGYIATGFAANVLALSMLQFAAGGKYKVWIVPFGSNVDRQGIHAAHDKPTALEAMRWLGTLDYNANGTDIQKAILWAYAKTQEADYLNCDIVLLTDGCSDIHPTKLKDDKPPRTILRSLFLGPHAFGAHTERIIAASDSHQRVDWDPTKQEFTLGTSLNGLGKGTVGGSVL